jgi:hypothetical protein
MRREPLRYWIATAAALTLAAELFTGVILWLALDAGAGRGFGRGGGREFAGVERHTWVDLHDWVGLTLGAVVVVHLALNWRWVVEQTRRLLAGPQSS